MTYTMINLFMGIGGTESFLVSVLVFALWLWALIDVIRRNFKDSSTKVIWILVILFIPILGPILYLIIGRK